jgi:hypothetical protein
MNGNLTGQELADKLYCQGEGLMSARVHCDVARDVTPGATWGCLVCSEHWTATEDGWRATWELDAREEVGP